MKKLWIVILLFISVNLCAEKKYPKNIFIAPVDYKMTLSGNFGELRKNHIHSGIDIKTDGVVGKKIYAIADGYVSRVKVSPTGFGKAIYITHPNGYTSVYGHLNRFIKEISAYVKAQQYKKKSFAVDLYLRKRQIELKQGEVIAFSGNSGGSEGPHLHFEIRETSSEKPVNPLLFGFKIKDFIRPKIKGIKIYPITERANINGKTLPLVLNAAGWGLNHRVKQDQIINVSGEIGFAINTYDLLNDSHNKNGVFSVELRIDSVLIYAHKMERFAFSESRYVNSLIDYEHYIDYKQRFQRSIVDRGNKLSTINKAINKGVVLFNDTLLHHLVYEIKDAYGNTSRFTCKLQSAFAEKKNKTKKLIPKNWFYHNRENVFTSDEVSVNFKQGAFYKSFEFKFGQKQPEKGFYSNIVDIHRKQTPVHKRYRLKVKTVGLPEKFHPKALLVCLNNKEPKSYGGAYADGYVKATPKELGRFAVMIDTIAPQIMALNIHNGKKISGYKKITFKVTDDLSGIKTYTGKLNGNWVLVEFDPKNDRMTYFVDHRMKKGKNIFVLEVSDNRNNKSSYSAAIYF
jgi:murein DD-endopeptidase MepM/ murein hydrolase activator NlpD